MTGTPEKIEVAVMYNRVKELTDAKAVLEKLATLTPEMGWSRDPKEIRFLAYATWLKEHGKEGWFEFLEESSKALQILMLGGMPPRIPEAPEGWIAPMDYFEGKIPKEAGK